MSTTTYYVLNKVKDMSLTDWGRTEIMPAEAEIAGLIALVKIGVEHETLRINQADYIGVKVEGPFKPVHYRF